MVDGAAILDIVKGRSPTLAVAAVAASIMVLAGIYLLVRYLRQNKNVPLIGPERKLARVFRSSASDMPDMPNGAEYAYTFWLFVPEAQDTEQPKFIAMRAAGSGAEDVVYMAAKTNTLHLAVNSSAQPNLTFGSNQFKTTIDYLPSQRWVHVVYVVANGTVTTYMDGDIYSVDTHTQAGVLTVPKAGTPLEVGGTGIPGVFRPMHDDAFVSGVNFLNYAPTGHHVRAMYRKGPRSRGLISMLTTAWGLRSPIYDTSAVPDSTCDAQ